MYAIVYTEANYVWNVMTLYDSQGLKWMDGSGVNDGRCQPALIYRPLAFCTYAHVCNISIRIRFHERKMNEQISTKPANED